MSADERQLVDLKTRRLVGSRSSRPVSRTERKPRYSIREEFSLDIKISRGPEGVVHALEPFLKEPAGDWDYLRDHQFGGVCQKGYVKKISLFVSQKPRPLWAKLH